MMYSPPSHSTRRGGERRAVRETDENLIHLSDENRMLLLRTAKQVRAHAKKMSKIRSVREHKEHITSVKLLEEELEDMPNAGANGNPQQQQQQGGDDHFQQHATGNNSLSPPPRGSAGSSPQKGRRGSSGGGSVSVSPNKGNGVNGLNGSTPGAATNVNAIPEDDAVYDQNSVLEEDILKRIRNIYRAEADPRDAQEIQNADPYNIGATEERYVMLGFKTKKKPVKKRKLTSKNDAFNVPVGLTPELLAGVSEALTGGIMNGNFGGGTGEALADATDEGGICMVASPGPGNKDHKQGINNGNSNKPVRGRGREIRDGSGGGGREGGGQHNDGAGGIVGEGGVILDGGAAGTGYISEGSSGLQREMDLVSSGDDSRFGTQEGFRDAVHRPSARSPSARRASDVGMKTSNSSKNNKKNSSSKSRPNSAPGHAVPGQRPPSSGAGRQNGAKKTDEENLLRAIDPAVIASLGSSADEIIDIVLRRAGPANITSKITQSANGGGNGGDNADQQAKFEDMLLRTDGMAQINNLLLEMARATNKKINQKNGNQKNGGSGNQDHSSSPSSSNGDRGTRDGDDSKTVKKKKEKKQVHGQTVVAADEALRTMMHTQRTMMHTAQNAQNLAHNQRILEAAQAQQQGQHQQGSSPQYQQQYNQQLQQQHNSPSPKKRNKSSSPKKRGNDYGNANARGSPDPSSGRRGLSAARGVPPPVVGENTHFGFGVPAAQKHASPVHVTGGTHEHDRTGASGSRPHSRNGARGYVGGANARIAEMSNSRRPSSSPWAYGGRHRKAPTEANPFNALNGQFSPGTEGAIFNNNLQDRFNTTQRFSNASFRPANKMSTRPGMSASPHRRAAASGGVGGTDGHGHRGAGASPGTGGAAKKPRLISSAQDTRSFQRVYPDGMPFHDDLFTSDYEDSDYKNRTDNDGTLSDDDVHLSVHSGDDHFGSGGRDGDHHQRRESGRDGGDTGREGRDSGGRGDDDKRREYEGWDNTDGDNNDRDIDRRAFANDGGDRRRDHRDGHRDDGRDSQRDGNRDERRRGRNSNREKDRSERDGRERRGRREEQDEVDEASLIMMQQLSTTVDGAINDSSPFSATNHNNGSKRNSPSQSPKNRDKQAGNLVKSRFDPKKILEKMKVGVDFL